MLYVAKRGLCLKILMQFPLLQSPRPYFSDHQWRKRTKIYIFSSMIAKEAEGSRLFLKFMRRIVGLRPDFQLPRTAFSNPAFKQLTAFPKNAKPPAHTFIYIDTPARERSRRFTKRHLCPLHKQKANAILWWPHRPAHPTPSRQMWNNRAGKTGLQKDGKL